MVPLSICSANLNLTPGNPCYEPTTQASLLQPLLGMEKLGSTLLNPLDVQESSFRKGLSVAGIRFHWTVYPAAILSATQTVPFYVTVRLALVKLEVDTLGNPSFLPNLFSPLDSDLGDVLWRGACIIYWPLSDQYLDADRAGCYPPAPGCVGNVMLTQFRHSDGTAGSELPQITGSYSRNGSHSQMERVKTKRFLNRNEAIFFVVSGHNPLDNDSPAAPIGYELFGVAATRTVVR